VTRIGLASSLAALLVASPAHAQLAVTAAVEYFQWIEDTSPIEVREQGPLFVLGLEYTQPKDKGWLFAYRGKVYGGSVEYDGALLSAPSVPVTSNTTYFGVTNEVQLRYRLAPRRSYWLDLVGGAGYDFWERELSSVQTEDYQVAYLRLGLALDTASDRGWMLGAGLKYPVWTEEDAHFTDFGYQQNPKLEPAGRVNPYVYAGFRFQSHLALFGYFDGYNFGDSDPVTVTTSAGGSTQFYQPASRQYNLGIGLQYLF
jgi:hypothetical protein